MRLDQESGRATFIVESEAPAKNDLASDEPVSLPRFQLIHGCGDVGSGGNVSSFAMNHFVQLVQMTAMEILLPDQTKTADVFLICVAIAPNGRKRIEVDTFPKDVDFAQRESLTRQIEKIEAPVIDGGPVAFAVVGMLRQVEEHSLTFFPTLAEAIKANGVEAAISETLDWTPAVRTWDNSSGMSPSSANWWWRVLFRLRQKAEPAASLAAAKQMDDTRQIHDSYEQWLDDCGEIAAQLTWTQLKREIMNAPDDVRFMVALAEKHSQQENAAAALQWYDSVNRRVEDCAPLLRRRAILHLRTGDTRAALNDCSRAVECAPEIDTYLVLRSSIYCQLPAWDEAAKDLDEAIRLASNEPETLYRRAEVRLRQDRLLEAIDDFREAIRLDPNFGYGHFRLGWVYVWLQDDKAAEAIEHLTRAIALIGDDEEIRLHRGLAYFAQRKYALALHDCEELLAKSPDHAVTHGMRGRILQCDGEFEEAIVACSRAIELGDEQASVYFARAISYAATDQWTLAASDCDVVLSIEPDHAAAIQLQGRLKLQSGDLDAAMESFNRARDLDPEWTEPGEFLALVHRMKENPQAAVDQQTKLIEQSPGQASHYVNRAFAYTQMRDYENAAMDYDRAIAIEPENESLYFLRGTFRMTCQELELAVADFDRVLAIEGDNDQARAYRAATLLQLRRYEEAIDDFGDLIAKHPDHPHAYHGRAYAFASIGNADHAQRDADQLSEMAPELADGVQRSTETANLYRLLRNGDYDTALDAANEMVADAPHESLGYRLRAHVRWEREEFVEACDDYTRVLDQDGPTADCLSSRGQVLAELGEWERALRDLDQAVEMAREAGMTMLLAYSLNGRSLTYAGMDREEESRRDFEESVHLCPTNPWVYYNRGIQMFHANRANDARGLLELALEFHDPPLSKRKIGRAKIVLDKLKATD